MLKNDRLIKALLRQAVDRRPLWLMRQAGRYLPEYRALRQRFPDFMAFCRNAQAACEATMQPLQRFPLDAAIVFSDILTVPDAMGVAVRFVSGQGPVIDQPIRSCEDLQRCQTHQAADRLDYVYETVSRVVDACQGDVPVIGFAGSPWTVAAYMIEGGSSKTFTAVRRMVYADADLMHALLTELSEVTIAYLNRQIEAGASVVMLFDSWGGLLAAEQYAAFSLSYCQRIAQSLHRQWNGATIPVVLFSRPVAAVLPQCAEAGFDALGIDYSLSMAKARATVQGKVALQGNLDPMCLFAPDAVLRDQVRRLCDSFAGDPGLVINLGHGIDQHTPVERVSALCHWVEQYGRL